MSPDEIERTVQFLLHQQAQFATDFEKLSTKTDRMADSLNRVTDGLIGLTSIVGQLATSQQHTDEQLRTVVQVFERHLREDHAHGPS